MLDAIFYETEEASQLEIGSDPKKEINSMQNLIRAAVVIQKEGRILLVQEGTPKVHGLWNWQQGLVDNGETVEQAAVREAKEETGLDVTIVKKLTVVKNPFWGTKEIHVFLGEIVGGQLEIAEGEILQAKWFAKGEIEAIKDQMPGEWVSETILSIS